MFGLRTLLFSTCMHAAMYFTLCFLGLQGQPLLFCFSDSRMFEWRPVHKRGNNRLNAPQMWLWAVDKPFVPISPRPD